MDGKETFISFPFVFISNIFGDSFETIYSQYIQVYILCIFSGKYNWINIFYIRF